MGNLKNMPKLRFPEFNGQWKTKKLSEVASIGRGKSKHRPRDAAFLFGGEYPFIQTGDIRKSELYLTEYNQTYSEAGLKQSKLWDENTLCITIAANIAETAILKIKACFPDSIIGLIPNEKETTVLFVKSLFDKFKFEIRSLSQGVAQANLNQEKLSKIEFSFPSLPEQQKIATFLISVDEKIQALKKKENLLETYKKGVMQKVFSQEYRFTDEKGEAFLDWEMKTLGEIAEIKKGEQLNKDELTDYGTYPCVNGGINPSGYTDLFNSDENTITISEGGNSCGYINYLTTKFWSGGHCYTLKVNNEKSTNNEFLFQLLKKYEIEIKRLRVGSGLPNIQKKDLLIFKFSFPSSIKEQTKIANFLSSIDQKISLTQVEIKKMEAWKKGLLQKMFV